MTPAARPVTLFTGQWGDVGLDELARLSGEWGFDGLELACARAHFDVDRALAEDGYLRAIRERLDRHGLGCWALGAHLVGQAVCDPIDARHRRVLPPQVWGDGDADGVRSRAAEHMKDTARAAARLGVTQVNGFTGSPIWHLLYSFPPNDFGEIERGYERFAEAWDPILDVFDAEGVRFGLEVHPTEIAYDFETTRRALQASAGDPRSGSTSTRRTSSTSTSTRPSSRSSSPTASTTSTSRTCACASTAAARSSARISTSATGPAGGTSCRRAAAMSTSRSSCAP